MKKILTILTFSAFTALSLLAEDSEDEVVKKVNESYAVIAEQASKVIIENTTILNVTPDAYIGKLVKSIPPHFSVAYNLSGTLMDTGAITDGLQVLFTSIKGSTESVDGTIDLATSLPKTIPLPAASLKFRIGGIFLPLDFGGFFNSTIPGTIRDVRISDYEFSLDYITFGGDIRLALMQGSLILPQISLGAGYVFQYQALHFGFTHEYNYDLTSGNPQTGNLSTASSFQIQTNTIFLTAQISKQFGITIPFFGVREMLTQYNDEFNWYYNLTKADGTKFEDDSKNGDATLTKDFDFTNLQTQLFGGLTLTAGHFELCLAVSWNIMTNYFTGAVTAGFKM